MPGAAPTIGVAADIRPTSRACTCLNASRATTGKRTEGVCWCLARPGTATPDAAAEVCPASRKCRCQEDVRATTSTQDKEPDEFNHDALWKTHDVRLLAKAPSAKLVKDFRPIAVLLVMYKLYSRVMYMLAEGTLRHTLCAAIRVP